MIGCLRGAGGKEAGFSVFVFLGVVQLVWFYNLTNSIIQYGIILWLQIKYSKNSRQ